MMRRKTALVEHYGISGERTQQIMGLAEMLVALVEGSIVSERLTAAELYLYLAMTRAMVEVNNPQLVSFRDEWESIVEHEQNEPDVSPGSPFDRGRADYYYRRLPAPHYWPDGTGKGSTVTAEDMTMDEVKAYCAGYASQATQKEEGTA